MSTTIGKGRLRRLPPFFLTLLLAVLLTSHRTLASDDYYASNYDDKYAYNNNNNNNNNYYYNNADDGNDDANGDDGNANAGDDAAAANDDANGDDGNAGDDDAYANQKYYYGDDYQSSSSSSSSNAYSNYGKYQDDWAASNADIADDDLFHWDKSVGFDGVSIMPISCVNYNNGHMIKFEFFKTDTSYQCHFSQIGTFVVSIAHYMRAYFNHQALVHGQDFELPEDVGYLNCVKIQQTVYSSEALYAKIGCMERETFTSTKLALHLYTDNTCSTPYDDGFTTRRHSAKGYEINGVTFSSSVSFRPPFYTCQTCKPNEISETFNKRAVSWYDDDYIRENGAAQSGNDDDEDEDEQQNKNKNEDDYYHDDAYLAANDDVNYNNRALEEIMVVEEAESTALVPIGEKPMEKFTPVEGQLEIYEKEFWESVVEEKQRALYDNAYSVDDWNMCQRVYKYGIWCDEDCRNLDVFRSDRWSGADIILLSIMCTFMSAMMLLIVAKRLKSAQKLRAYNQDDAYMPGLPPVAMLSIYVGIMTIVVVMAKLKFVNETLVFAVVTCLLLFIYMLKLTLFDTRRPVLLAATRHDLFDNPMDERLF